MAQHYFEAGKILDKMMAAGAKPFSLKKMLYAKSDKKVSLGAVFALVSETLKYKKVLDDLLDHSGIMDNKELHGKGHILHVMLYDLLFSKTKSISGGGTLKKLIMAHSVRLQGELVKMKVKYKIDDFSELIPEHLRNPIVLPRWVRVNHLQGDMKTAKYFFEKDGWTEIPFDDFFKQLDEIQDFQTKNQTSGKSNNDKAPKLGKHFCVDRDLPDLLAFPPLTDFHDHPLLHSGIIVLQDKASALSGAALEVPASPDSVALDACAAPGQKTSQVAQTMKNQGKLFAFDLDATRLETLKKLCKRNGLKNLTAINSSFLEIDTNSEPFCDVEYILLDPSCSGSGIVNRLDYFLSSNADEGEAGMQASLATAEQLEKARKERALKLQEFQLSMLKKAFSFPNVKKIVYSTCSIHDEENEQVVEKALKLSPNFDVVKVLPKVPMRGKEEYPHGQLCVRTVPERDHTIGFFVSLFERKPGTFNPKKRKTPTPTAPSTAEPVAVEAKPTNPPAPTKAAETTKTEEAQKSVKKPKLSESSSPSNNTASQTSKSPQTNKVPESNKSSQTSKAPESSNSSAKKKKNKKHKPSKPLLH